MRFALALLVCAGAAAAQSCNVGGLFAGTCMSNADVR
jgi:hypothetical protein